ncbi:hypothetical protein ABVK25_002340 [Lepraria finkii]|uniref:Uncharacterized protein n=1 Tax=Lepraria finkii TaxID=1340010 RepID=A0ABR4BIQ9_9LECA
MNWTGGNLSRSRNANTSVTAKQKNHFAKVRAKLQNDRSFTPAIQTFDFGHYEAGRPSRAQSGSTKKHRQLREQTTLDDFKNTGMLVRKLESLKPRSNKRKRTPFKQEQSNSQTQPESHHKGRSASPIVISSQSSSSSSSQSSHKATVTQVQSPASSSSSVPSHTSIEAKRHQLLQMQDWVGVECKHSKPVHMQFTDARDRDMIGRRRRIKKPISYLQATHHQPVRRRDHLEEPRGLASPDQHFSVGQMSIRIGSAADKSAWTPISDEVLFDSEANEADQRQSPAVPTIKAGELGSLLLPDHGQHDIRTPSAFMDRNSSHSSSSAFAPLSHRNAHIFQRATLPVDAEDDDESFLQTRGSEIELTYEEPEPAQEEPRFRLVFENTPQPYAQASEARASSPIVRDFTLPRVQTPVATQMKPVLSRGQEAWLANGHHPPNDHSSGNHALSTSPFTMAASKHLMELQNYGLNIASQGNMSKCMDKGRETLPVQNLEQIMSSDVLEAAPANKDPRIPARINRISQQKPRTTQEEESLWRSFTMLDDLEGTKSLIARPASNNSAKEPATKPHWTSTAPPPQAAEEDEQIWHSFIFSDDDPNSEWTIVEPLPPTQTQSPYNPSYTQPAEAATSPIKQKPHVDMLKASFDETTVSPNGSFYRPGTLASSSVKARHTTDILSGSLAEASPDTEDSIELLEESTFQPKPTDIYSMLVEASPAEKKILASKPCGSPSLPKPATPKDSLSALITQATSLLQKLPRKHDPPSLVAEASSGSMQAGSNPVNVSSDELQWSPVRAPPALMEHKEPKVVFTPPKRYVGERAADPPERVTLNRVLRNEKRLRSQTGKKGRKSKANAKPEVEDDEDDIEDD